MRMLGIFKRKVRKTIGWEDVTLAQFEQMEAITKDSEGMKELRLQRLLYGEDGGSIEFVAQEPPKKAWKKKYTIGGREYRLQADMTKFSISQFIDYQGGKTLREWLSVVLIPSTAERYNDGTYDVEEVKREVGAMKIVDAVAVSVFLKRQSQALLVIMQGFLEEQTKKIEGMRGLSEREKKILQLRLTEFSLFVEQFANTSI